MKVNGKTQEVEVNLPKDVLFDLMLMAHKKDITLNQLCNEILREQLSQEPET
jgi:hypothetical protein